MKVISGRKVYDFISYHTLSHLLKLLETYMVPRKSGTIEVTKKTNILLNIFSPNLCNCLAYLCHDFVLFFGNVT